MKQFTRTKEDFICEHCGAQVVGDGYTDHCPHCLYGKHVDIFPGDRLEICQGMLRPVSVNMHKGQETLSYRCSVCGAERVNKVAKNDSREAIVALAQKYSAESSH